LPIKHVRIEGTFKYVTRAEVSKPLSSVVQTSYFGMDAGAITEKVASLEWVKAAKVRRVWPDEIIVSFEEQRPVAIWNERALLNADGEIFKPSFDSAKLELPYLYGVDNKSAVVLKKQEAIQALLAELELSAVHVDLAEHGNLSVVISSGASIKVSHELAEKKIKKSLMALASLKGNLIEHVKTIDLRYPNGMAVTWVDGYVLGQSKESKSSLSEKGHSAT